MAAVLAIEEDDAANAFPLVDGIMLHATSASEKARITIRLQGLLEMMRNLVVMR